MKYWKCAVITLEIWSITWALIFKPTCANASVAAGYFMAKALSDDPKIDTCFTPNERCDVEIITAINQEQKSLYVQAYQLTNIDIESAIVDAKKRGVDVKVILDKSQYRTSGTSSSSFLSSAGIPVWIDYKPAIAHNKVMILGDKEVITGSYNFTNAAQKRNAENMLIIQSKEVAKDYENNFNKRLSKSLMLSDYIEHKNSKERNK